MIDYEEMILEMQESEEDDCKTCYYKGEKCRNQCMREAENYNPIVATY